MNQWKRFCGTALSGVLVLSLIAGSGADSNVEGKGKKATLKTKTVTVKVGKTKKITLKNKKKGAKYTFTSSKKKIATVNKSGLVRGVKAGKARITVKETSGKKKRTVGKVKVTVKKVTSSKAQASPTNTPSPSGVATATATPTATPAATATVEPTFEIPVPTSGPLETKKLVDKNNTISAQRYMADPYAIEYEGRIYVYGTNDSQSMVIKEDGKIPANKYSNINTLNCVSTTDMVNWRDEGIIQVAGKKGVASWANNSWAPAVAHKKIDGKDKFFIYFADNGSGIGVLEADSPTGPWKDPIGKQLISRQTPTCAEVPWLFDPAVLVDDDGQGYLYFGGIGEATDREHPKCNRVVKLTDNMIGLKEDPQIIDAPAPFEDSGINKFNGKYYYSYCTNWDGADKRPNTSSLGAASIAYIVSDNPMGPWTEEAKVVLKNPTAYFSGLPSNDKNNNHHCMFEYKGQYYMFYHSQKMAADKKITQGYRNSGVDLLEIDENGNLTSKMSLKGVPQIMDFNPYETVEAETFAWSVGTSTEAGPQQNNTRSNRVLSSIHKGDFVGMEGVQFGTEAPKKITMNIASATGEKVEGKIHVYQKEMKAENEIGVIDVSADKDYKDITGELTKAVTGKERLFFIFDVEGILLDTWQLSK